MQLTKDYDLSNTIPLESKEETLIWCNNRKTKGLKKKKGWNKQVYLNLDNF